MPTKITMPQLGESVAEGTIGRWLKQEGDTVKKDESLVEIITDKVTAELPSPVSGRLVRILVQEDETVKIGVEIAEIEDSASATSSASAQATTASSTATPASSAPTQGSSGATGGSSNGGYARTAPVPVGGTTAVAERLDRVSPLARRVAQEHDIDLRQVQGTGEAGRIRKEDIEAFIGQRSQAPAATQTAPVATTASVPVVSSPPATTAPATSLAPTTPAMQAGADDQTITPSPARRAIAEHMVRSKQTSPHAFTAVEIDMTTLARWLAANKDEFKRREGYSISFQTFAIKAVAEALREHPYLNASWTPEGKILLRKEVHIGVSIALENNLMVPVIRNADMLNIAGVARAVNDLVTRARTNRLTPADLQGGTFTVNNPGVFGTILSMAIINQPNAAILTMDAVVKRAVVVNDAIAIRSMMFTSLSFDHRVLDGLQAARFLGAVKKRIEGWGTDINVY